MTKTEELVLRNQVAILEGLRCLLNQDRHEMRQFAHHAVVEAQQMTAKHINEMLERARIELNAANKAYEDENR